MGCLACYCSLGKEHLVVDMGRGLVHKLVVFDRTFVASCCLDLLQNYFLEQVLRMPLVNIHFIFRMVI